MSVLKKLAGETALYGISSIVGRFVYFLLVPLHTYIFDKPESLADNNELFIYATLFNIIYTYGMETTFFRFGTTLKTRQHYYNIILTSVIVSSVVMSGLLIIFAEPLINLLGYPGKQRLIVWLAMIIAIDACVAIPFARLRMENKAKRFVKIRLINIGINVFLNLFYLGFCRAVSSGKMFPELAEYVSYIYNPTIGADYIIWANFIANLYLIWALRKELIGFKFSINWQAFKPLWQYGFPILIMGLAGNINQIADRLMFRHLLPEGFYPGQSVDDAFGIYTSCYKLAILMAIVTQAFRYAADPFFFSKTEDKNAPPVFAQVMKWFIIAGCFLWVCIGVNLEVFGLILGENYRSGLVAVPILLFANLLVGIYWNLSVWFKLTDKTYYAVRITFIGMMCSIILNLLLIPKIGYVGSAISFTISSMVMVVICYQWGQKHFPVPYQVKSALFYIGTAGILILTDTYVSFTSYIVSVIFSISLCLIFSLTVYLREVYSKRILTINTDQNK
jgi:O-antigen/teichoic acid export membrane protein